MKSKVKLLLLVLVIALFATTGCDKENDEPTNTDLLVKEWKVISVDGVTIPEGEGLLALLKFENNGNCSYTVIDEGDTFSTTFKWSWGNNEETLNMNLGFGGEAVWTIDKLTADEFWYYDDSDALFKLVPNK